MRHGCGSLRRLLAVVFLGLFAFPTWPAAGLSSTDALASKRELCAHSTSLGSLLTSGWLVEPSTSGSTSLGKSFRWVSLLSSTSSSRRLAARLFGKGQEGFCENPASSRLFFADPTRFQDMVVFEAPQRRISVPKGEDLTDHSVLDDLFEAVSFELSDLILLVVDRYERPDQNLLDHLLENIVATRNWRSTPKIGIVHVFPPNSDLRAESAALTAVLPDCNVDGWSRCTYNHQKVTVQHFVTADLPESPTNDIRSFLDLALSHESPIKPLEALVSSLNTSLIRMAIKPKNFSLALLHSAGGSVIQSTTPNQTLDLITWPEISSMLFDDFSPRYSTIRRVDDKGVLIELKGEVGAVGPIDVGSVRFSFIKDGLYVLSYDRQYSPIEQLYAADPTSWKFYRRAEAGNRVKVAIGVPSGTELDSETLRITRVHNSLLLEIAASKSEFTPIVFETKNNSEVEVLWEAQRPKPVVVDGPSSNWKWVSVALALFVAFLIWITISAVSMVLRVQRTLKREVNSKGEVSAEAIWPAVTFENPVLDYLVSALTSATKPKKN